MAEPSRYLKKLAEEQRRIESERAAQAPSDPISETPVAESAAVVEQAASDAIASVYAAKAAAMPSGAQTMKTAPATQYAAATQNVAGASTAPLQYIVPEEVKQKMAAEAAAKRTADILEADRKRKAQAEKDRATMEAGAAELAAWSDEDKQNLVRYVSDRSNQFADMFGAQQFNNYNTNPLVQKYGIGKVRQMAEIYERQQNEELAKRTAEKAKNNVTGGGWNGIGQSVASVGANMLGSMTGVLGRVQEAQNRTGQFSTLQQYTAGDMPSLYASTVRGEITENIQGDQYDEQGNQISEGGAVRQGLAYGYQGVMSLADSIARGITLGAGGGAALAAAGSFAQSISDASEAGATPAQAVLMGVATAGMEYITEKIPMDEVFKVAKSGNANVLMQMFKQAGVEISTEELSLFGTLAAEAAIMQEDSSYNQMIANAMANGMTYEEAKAQANDAIWKQVQETAIVSGIAGAGSGGGSAIVGNVRNRINQTPTQTEKATEAATAPDTAAQQTEAITTAAEAERAAEAPQQTAERRAAQDVADMLTDKKETAQPETAAQVNEQVAEPVAEHRVVEETPAVEQQMQPGIKGTGAAEQNFSGKAQYQDLLYEGNVQPDREDDVRPMEVPKTDLQGNPVSATAANVYGSQFTTDDLASEEENAIARGDLSYMKIENGAAAERASKNIENAGGWEEAYMQWHDAVRDGKTSAEMAARGAMLLNHAAEVYEQTKTTGNDAETKAAKQKWLNILMDVRELGTNTAQGLQAMRMIRELAPPDKLDFAVATVRRMVANMKLQNDVTIDENLLNEYRMAETDEQRSEIMGRIQQNVADQIPSTFLDKWTALRYMNMLGNLKTNVRNVAGNVGSAIAYRIKDQFAATMEDFISAFDKDYQRTKAHAVSRELLNYAKKDFDAVKNTVSGGGKYNERMTADGEFQQGVMDKRTIFKSDNAVLNTVMKPLEAYRRGTNWMMNNQYFGDEAFGRAAYARAMAGYLKANGINAKNTANIDQTTLDKARAYAIREAQEATFKDNTALANIASNIKKATGVVGEGIVPFTKTPANVLVRAEEFSPLGLLNTAYKAAQMAASKTKLTEKNGLTGDFARSGENVSGADIVNSLAKTLTGTALFALGAKLWDTGMLSAGPSDDEEEATLDDLTGKQPYALQFMGEDGKMHSYTMDWLTPIAMPMFMGAEFWKALQEKGDGIQFADLEQLFTSIADPMIQMSMLQGLNDSLDSIKYSENNLGQFFLNAAASYLTQGLTNTLIGQIERSTEENRMTTYVDENSSIPKWVQQAAGKASQKIPGWDYQQMEYRNKWGDTEKNEGGLMYNLASPGYFSTEQNDAVSKELYRLNETVSEKVAPPDIPKKLSYTDVDGTDHKDYRLTEEQYQKIAEVQGQTAKRILDRMVESNEYKNLTDTEKAYAIDAVYEYAQERGKTAALSRYYSRADEWVRNAKESDLQTFIVQGSKKFVNSVISGTGEALGNNWTVSKAAKDDLKFAWESYSKMGDSTKDAILEAAAGDAAKYLIARGDGVSVNSYLDAVGNVKRLSPEDGKKQVSDAQKYEAIANTKSVSQDERDALMRAYMPDYDPDNGKTEKTEIRYDYLRQEMKLTPEKTIAAMRIASGDGKKADKFAAWKAMGMSDTQCNTLWNALESTAKSNPVNVVEWSNSKTK